MSPIAAEPVAARSPVRPPLTAWPRSVVGRRYRLLAWVNLTVDAVAILLGYVMSRALVHDTGTLVTRQSRWVFLTIPLWFAVFATYDLYDRRSLTAASEELRRLFHATVVAVVVVVMVTFWTKTDVSRAWIAGLAFSCMLTVGFGRLLVRRVMRRLNARGWLTVPAVVVGVNAEARTIARSLARHLWMGYAVVGFISVEPGPETTLDGLPVLGAVGDVAEVVSRVGAGAVVVAGTAVGSSALLALDADLQSSDVQMRVSPGLPHVGPSRISVFPVDGLALLSLERRVLGPAQARLKRLVDIVGAGMLLLITSPLMAALALTVRLTSRGPVFFRQERVGRNGQPFVMYKLRTMVPDAEAQFVALADAGPANRNGLLFKMPDDPRITRAGRPLRKLGFDELPQLFNVFKGDMSLVGPRPALPIEAAEYDERLRLRLRVKPGLTGLWQVNGRHDLPFDDYVRYDLYYVENWSLGLDAYIMAKTLPALFSRRGAY
jgi:exopolysaccharide biosynthesis polyprenyl glycosylphosphotransferase